jgi:glycosyltransferase involved in cell wall biosynthesis
MINILYLCNWNHPKNHNALMNYKNIKFTHVTTLNSIDLSKYAAVYSPDIPVNTKLYPNTKFIFGPHFSVFPEKNQIDMISNPNTIYIQPSEWVVKVWKDNTICNNLKVKVLPFGVDTEKFTEIKPINERQKVFIYYKSRVPKEIEFIRYFLNNKNIEYRIFNYDTKYNEDDYLNYLHDSIYGIWIGRHESQGFALEEALSCNVPLFVWNVKSMNQEYKSTYSDIPATTIPYWDERCGEFFYNINDIEEKFNLFLDKLNTYKPREYVLENLSMEVCENKLIALVNL